MTFAAAVFLVLGLALLFLGGDWLVRGAVSLAERLGVSALLIGLTVVGFGTSTPELVTSLEAAFAGAPGIAVGNVVGSNTANVLLIVGIAALLQPVTAERGALLRDGTMLIVATVLCVLAVLAGAVGRVTGLVFVVCLVLYVVVSYLLERRRPTPSAALHAAEAEHAPHVGGTLWLAAATLIGGLALTILGARWLVTSAIELAAALGVSDTFVGLTVVAVGTSLPELVASVMAARRGHSDVALGNVVGSSIYNILGILGVTALIHPIAVPAQIQAFDVWIMVGAHAALLVAAFTGRRVGRREGAALLAAYVAYTLWLARLAMAG